MGPSRDSTLNKRAHQSPLRSSRGPSPRSDDDQPREKKRAQRAAYACERCRVKKLRCAGGNPCIVCRRAHVECDFGDRGETWLQSSATTHRISQLERTVTDLVSGLSQLVRPPVGPQPSNVQSPAQPSQPVLSSEPITSTASSALSADPNHPLSSGPKNTHNLLRTSSLSNLPSSATVLSGAVFTQGQPLYQNQHDESTTIVTPQPTSHSSPLETIDSRWNALQHSLAPFPAMMAHPTAWSGRPATTSPRGVTEPKVALGMTHYHANVNLQSEPVSEGVIDASMAKELFQL